MTFVCVVGLPPSTTASPSRPNQAIQASITALPAASSSGWDPPW